MVEILDTGIVLGPSPKAVTDSASTMAKKKTIYPQQIRIIFTDGNKYTKSITDKQVIDASTKKVKVEQSDSRECPS